MPDGTRTAADLIRRLLDKGYTDATGAVINAIARNGSSGVMAKRLDDLNAEVARLEAAGELLSPDNPVARALLADFEDAMRANRALVASAADDVQLTGIDAAGQIVRQMSIPGWSDDMLASIGVRWNQPNPEAVKALVDYVRRDAFITKLAKYESGTTERIQSVLVNTFVQGFGPRKAAGVLAQAVQGLPTNYAHQLLRTLQLTASRVHRWRTGSPIVTSWNTRSGSRRSMTGRASRALHSMARYYQLTRALTITTWADARASQRCGGYQLQRL